MKAWKFCILLFVISFYEVSCWKKFWRGRIFDGGEQYELGAAEDLWFEQYLDHFDPTNTNTWKQRYFVQEEFHKTNGPVFLMIGGEGEASAKWMHEGSWVHYAKNFDALCFQLEHRYYGKSHPTDDLSTKNLAYLNSEQALADLAYFIIKMKDKYKLDDNSKWIAFGGSYPGSLAAWLRKKYPHLIHGSISSSGPLLAKIDFAEYFQVVEKSLGTYEKDDCVSYVKESIQQVDMMLKHMIGQRSIDEKFKLCDPIEKSVENPLDVSNLFEALSDNFAGVVQYNKDNRSGGKKLTIDDVCDVMSNKTMGPPVTRLAAVNKMIMEQDEVKCLDYKYSKMVSEMRNTSWEATVAQGQRQWTYQTCTEFGFYQTSNSPNSLFGNKFPAEFFVQQCTDVYGPRFTLEALQNDIERTNMIYGALKPETTNVLYVNGKIDPWHALSLLNGTNNQPTILIEGTAHCANMYEPSKNDLPQLKDARMKIYKYLSDILQ